MIMDFKFTFEDGSIALAHHGVKGMKWGVWNSETAARYGSRNIIKKGEKFSRITNINEAYKNLDLSKPLYVSSNASDFKEYAKLSQFLPSVRSSEDYKKQGKLAVMELVADKDLNVATKEDVQKYVLDKYGNTKMSFLRDNTVSGGDTYNLLSEAAKQGNPTVREYYKTSLDSVPFSTKTKGELAVHELFAVKVGSHEDRVNPKSHKNRDAMREHFKKKGYDAMVDYEDASSQHLDVKEPLVLLNPKDSVSVSKRKKTTYEKINK